MTTTKIVDEFNNRWAVQGAEPATKFVSRLVRNNYSLVVLPARMLATGVDSGETPEVEDIIHRVRLLDCLNLIRKGA